MQNTKNIFIDFHHEGLLYSLIKVFEGRLGYNVFRPIGMEWYDQDFWMVHPSRDTAEQYLSLQTGYQPKDGTHPLNELKEFKDGIYYVHDKYNNFDYKGITLETFKKMPIDIVISSIPQHIHRFKNLISRYKPNAKFIYQIGNQWDAEGDIPNFMASARIEPRGNFVTHHQEFDLNIFSPFNWIRFNVQDKPVITPVNNIYSFMNVPQNMKDYDTFLQLEQMMPNWNFKAFGGQARDGNMEGYQKLADKMRSARFVWHVKYGGDGYGHIIHNAAAVGIPAIVNMEYYRGKLAEDLMIDGKTCINIEGLSLNSMVNKIDFYNQEEKYRKMCIATYENFKAKVDFEKDAEAIITFLSHLR